MASSESEVVVVMVPFVAQGHLNQLLHLSGLLSAYNLPIHFISTATNCRQARHRLHGGGRNPNNLIHFHELPDPEFISPPPNPTSTTHFPTHLQPSFNSSLHLRRPVAAVIRSLSATAKRVAVVHDSLMSYVVQDVESIPNAETYIFRALSVFYIFCFQWERLGRKLPFEPHDLLPSSGESMTPEFMEFIKLQYSHQRIHVGNLYDSSRLIEGRFLELLEKDSINGKNHWAVGPFNPVEIQSEILDSDSDPDSDPSGRQYCLQWLDKQPENSVIYVSFGTTTTFTEQQIRELAIGLEKSGQRFLWVLREADKGEVFTNDGGRKVRLPEQFEEKVAARGLVVRDWAPQLDILGHRSTGGFISHCGWNSSMEAMTAGIAIAAWPMHSDQPRNAFLMAEVLGVALMMREWSCRYELFTSEMVEKVVRKLMGSEEGAVIRRRAAELGGELRRSMAEGGVGRNELKSLVEYIRR